MRHDKETRHDASVPPLTIRRAALTEHQKEREIFAKLQADLHSRKRARGPVARILTALAGLAGLAGRIHRTAPRVKPESHRAA